MRNIVYSLWVGIFFIGLPGVSVADDFGLIPYGTAKEERVRYKPRKVVVEFSSTPEDARADLRQLVFALHQFEKYAPGTKVKVVVIGGGIALFAIENYDSMQGVMDEIATLVKESGVEIDYCGASATGAGLKSGDLHGFGKTVPAGYPQIVDAVAQGYTHIFVKNYKTGNARHFFKEALQKEE